MWSLLKKIPKSIWVCIVSLLIISLFLNNEIREREERLNKVKSLYQIKNDFAFLTFLKRTPSYIPLAETLESISKVKDTEDPAKVQKLIEKAKTESERLNQDMLFLIEFSDDYTVNADPKFMINYSVMNTHKQNDMFLLAFQSNIWGMAYTTSYEYWKAKPKVISKETKNTLNLIAAEVRLLNKTMVGLKERTSQLEHMVEFEPMYDESLKKALLDELKPHLERLRKIKDDHMHEKYSGS